MVAVINAGKSLRNILHYNEQKVELQKADLIQAMHFGKDSEQLLFKDKLRRLEKLTSLNKETKINSIHISLNFDPSEKLSTGTLRDIAGSYMEGIGFGNQPYLVYQHHDAGHPHIHIVTTNIQNDGSRIKLHNIGRNQSEKARLSIEQKFNLVQAQQHRQTHYQLNPINTVKVQYGKSEIKRAITNVLDAVIPHYKYTSIAELNAVLKQYNVLADRGSEDSRIYKNKGLVYRILNEKGEKVGVPIKASLIYNKPTLSSIQARFGQNNEARQRYKQRIKNGVDLSFVKNPNQTLPALQQALEKEQIHLLFRQNEAGVIYGLTYIDHQTKCVFNGSDVGKPYSANGIQQRCVQQPQEAQQVNQIVKSIQQQKPALQTSFSSTSVAGVLQQLTEPQSGSIASEWKEDIKRKRKKKQHQ